MAPTQRIRRFAAALVLVAAPVALLALPASGDDVEAQAILIVTTTTDGGAGSLREAVETLATNAGGDTVVLASGATYTFTCAAGGDLDHGNTPLTIQGDGATLTMAAGCNQRLLNNGTGALVLQDLNITGVNTTFAATIIGALVNTEGSFALVGGTVANNTLTTVATDSMLGVFNAASYNASGVTFSSNTFTTGGSFFAIFDGAAVLSDCSFTDTTITTGGIAAIFGGITESDATVTNCPITNFTATAAGSLFGGLFDGNATLTNSPVTNLTATSTTSSVFGGVANLDLTVIDSVLSGITVSADQTMFGGVSDADLTLVLSSILDVTVTAGGTVFGGLANDALLMLHSTVAGLTVTTDGSVIGDVANGAATIINSSVFDTSGTSNGVSDSGTFEEAVTLVYATLFNNSSASGVVIGGPNLATFGSAIVNAVGGSANCAAGIVTTSSGYNRADDTTCALATPTDVQAIGFNPLFGTNTANGGPGPTLLPLTGSPLIDAIPIAQCQADGAAGITTDERLLPRPSGEGCDIGAVEVQVPPPPTPIVIIPAFTG